MTMPDEQSKVSSALEKGSPIQFVEMLVDEHDYWLSLTDAARVTRTSEATVRRWVSRGRLPVKQEPVGINQRTRLVRASDVARLRPIVDPTAAITDQLHTLDLLSIPRQQIHLVQEQGKLLEVVRSVQQMVQHLIEETRAAFEQETIRQHQQEKLWERQLLTQREVFQQVLNQQRQQHEALALLVHDQAQDIEQRYQELNAQMAQHERDQETLRTTLLDQLDAVRQELEKLDQTRRTREEQIQREYGLLLQQQEMQFHQILQGIEETLATQNQERLQTQHRLSELQQMISASQQALTILIEQQVSQSVFSFEEQLAQGKVALGEQIEQLEKRLEQMAIRTETERLQDQEQMKIQEQQIQRLTVMLQQEMSARKVLETRLSPQEDEQQR